MTKENTNADQLISAIIDGIEDVNESNSGINNGPNDPGTDPLDPDTDDEIIQMVLDVLPCQEKFAKIYVTD